MDYLTTLNNLAFQIGYLEGQERAEYYKSGLCISKPNLEIKQKVLEWESLAKLYLQQLPQNLENKNLKKQLLDERSNWRQKGLIAFSETIVKSKKTIK